MPAGQFAILACLAVIVGALIPIQAATNAAMARAVGSVPISSLFVFAVGLAVTATWVALAGLPLPNVSTMRAAPIYGYFGGLIVASYVISITFLAPRLGVGNAICFIVT